MSWVILITKFFVRNFKLKFVAAKKNPAAFQKKLPPQTPILRSGSARMIFFKKNRSSGPNLFPLRSGLSKVNDATY